MQVFYGRPSGLVTNAAGTALDDQFLEQASPGIPGSGEPGDQFGLDTAFGDFNGDNCADLAIGSPGEDASTGAVTLLYGSQNGLRTTGVQRITMAGLVGLSGAGSGFGGSLVVADFDDDDVDDLAIGASGASLDGLDGAGAVVVAFGARRVWPAAPRRPSCSAGPSSAFRARPSSMTASVPGWKPAISTATAAPSSR